MADSPPMISIVISTWNSIRYIKECIESILELNTPNLEVIVVDSNSTDGTIQYLASVKDRLNLIVVHNPRKVTWSDANQMGLDISRGEWICLSNPDIVFNKCFSKMLDECRKLNILAAAPQLIYPDGSPQRAIRTMTPWLSLYMHTRLVRLLLKIAGKRPPNYHYRPDARTVTSVDSPQGSFLVFNRKVLSILDGRLWNRGYRIGVSDYDAFLNLKRRGIPIKLFSSCRIVHYGSYISKRHPSWVEYDQAYGLVLYFRYWSRVRPRVPGMFSPHLYSVIFGLEGVAAAGLDIAGRIIKHRNPFFNPKLSAWRAGQRLAGLIDGWRYKVK